MTIAAHIVLSKKNGHHYLLNNIIVLAKRLPGDHFIIFTDDTEMVQQLNVPNITPVLIKPAIKNNLSFYYWYNFKLPSLLKRYDAGAFISESGAVSLRTAIPQFLFLKESFFSSQDKHLHKRYLLKYLPRFAEKAAGIFTAERFIAAAMRKKFPQAAEKNVTVYHGINNIYQPLSWEEKENVMNTFTSGKDYFIYHASQNTQANIRTGLKAFSIFKKWQKSAMKMILLLDNVPAEGLVPDMDSYKYRDDVVLIAGDTKTAAPLIAAALAVLYLPKKMQAEHIAFYSMQCRVPLITLTGDDARLTYGEAAVYAEPTDKSVAEKMLLLYKDESLRKAVVESGVQLLLNYDVEKSATEMLLRIRD